jgi:hypothetical protein
MAARHEVEGLMNIREFFEAVAQPMVIVRDAPATVSDSGKVRLGLTSPSFPPVRVTPSRVDDSGKVRLGLTSPSFPPVPAAPSK